MNGASVSVVETAVGAGPFAQALEQPFLGIFSVSCVTAHQQNINFASIKENLSFILV